MINWGDGSVGIVYSIGGWSPYPKTRVLLIFLRLEVAAKKRAVEQIVTCQVLWWLIF